MIRKAPLRAALLLLTLGACGEFAWASADPWRRPDAVPVPADNALTAARVELGKMLFFDPRLSGSNWISCASCHNPGLGWSDGLPVGFGHDMQALGRNTPTILNTAYNPVMMWDGRNRSLEQQALGPMSAAAEMNQDLEELVGEIAALPEYRRRFSDAYPGESLDVETIAKAIASFERTIISADAPFDRWRRGEPGAVSEAAARGFELFKGKARCDVCHSGWNFTDNSFHNIGIGDDDPGRYARLPLASMKGAFKTPTLRDVALTAPYMHDGSLASLEAVIEHYDQGGAPVENLSREMRPLGLTQREKDDLLAFLNSLTAPQMVMTVPKLPQ